MISTLFYDRRREAKSVEMNKRKNPDRRSQENEGLPEKRRLASQIRRYERDSFKVPVRLKTKDSEVSGYTHDISPEGLLVFSDTSLSPGTPMSLQFFFGESFCSLNISGQVLFCHLVENKGSTRYAIGMKFSGIRDFEKRILTSSVIELRQYPDTYQKSLLNIRVSTDTLSQEAGSLRTHKALEEKPRIILKSSAKVSLLSADKPQKSATRRGRKFTPDPSWVVEMNQLLDPDRQAILQCRLVQETSTGELSLGQIRAWNVQFYPFIESFPQFMALNLAKELDPMARSFLIDNVRVEKRHADAWIDMAKGFGIDKEQIFSLPILPEVEALTHWLWSINHRGSLAEGIAATNFAIEGVTQGIATIMVKGFDKYDGKNGVHLDKKAYWWMEAHALYDDLHPFEALEIIKCHSTSCEMQQRVKHAAKRSLEYLFMALEACYVSYA